MSHSSSLTCTCTWFAIGFCKWIISLNNHQLLRPYCLFKMLSLTKAFLSILFPSRLRRDTLLSLEKQDLYTGSPWLRMSWIYLRMEVGRASRVSWFCSNLRIWSRGQREMSRWMLDIWENTENQPIGSPCCCSSSAPVLAGRRSQPGGLWWSCWRGPTGPTGWGHRTQEGSLTVGLTQGAPPCDGYWLPNILCSKEWHCCYLKAVRLWKDAGIAAIRLKLSLRWVSLVINLPHPSSMWTIWFFSKFKMLSFLKSATILGSSLMRFSERLILRKVDATLGKLK